MLAQELAALAEKYMDTPRLCFLCREAPATAPMVYVSDSQGEGERVRGCVFAVCTVCRCTEGFQARVSVALRQDQYQGEAVVWN